MILRHTKLSISINIYFFIIIVMPSGTEGFILGVT